MQLTTPHLSNPPLIMALAKVEFANVPQGKLESGIEALHELLREDYPDIKKVLSNNLSLNLSNNDKGEVASNIITEQQPNWIFRSADYDWAIHIDSKGLLVTTKAYESSENLCARIRTILDALDTAVRITHTKYVGVRFINKISVDPSGEFSALRSGYIQEQLPFTDGMGGSSYAARYKTEDSWLDIRSNLVVGGHEVTEDLLDVAAYLNIAKEPVQEVFVIIDIDCKFIIDSYVKYDLNKLGEQIEKLTDNAKLALAHVLTEEEIQRRK
ncbi:TIGR04255 family protein [Vibrio harveyi]|uniref:TIGR04255 family protein n=1 Tax=Vibrio harveyi TaxID=669 RepID=UPI003CF7DED9|nr:TIGR04255 family protein [Vibrio harveyi]